MIVYKFENKINGKIYIGKTINALSKRILVHLRNKDTYFQRALNKYGMQSFSLSVIDYAQDKNKLDEKEKHWIKFYDCKAPKGYNLTDGGEGLPGYSHTEEAKNKMRNARLGKRNSKESNLKRSKTLKEIFSNPEIRKKSGIGGKKNKGRKRPDLSERNRQSVGKKVSKEVIESLIARSVYAGPNNGNWKGGKKEINCANKNCDEVIKVFPCIQKKYCSRECMRSDPEYRKKLGRKIVGIGGLQLLKADVEI